jgi:hypothetical protein
VAAPSASPVTDPEPSLKLPAAPGTAERVKAQLQGDYPPGALAWVDDLTWAGPVRVPVAQIDRSSGDTNWADAARNTAKVSLFKRKIAGGFRKPIVLVRTPGGGKLFAVDGHTRTLACASLGVPVTAWVGTSGSAHGDWEHAHARQLANDAPALDLSAQTAALEVTPAPYGRPGGPGLYGVKGQKHSDYFEAIVGAMLRKGKTKAEASAMAWGILRRWAAGGGRVHPEVRAAASAALAEEAAKSGHSHASDAPGIDLAGMFVEQQHPRVAAGQSGGGRFGSKGGAPVAAARARHAPKVTAPMATKPEPPGDLSRIHQLRFQAASDRHLAHQILIKVGTLVQARNAAIAGIPAHAAGKPRSAAAVKAAAARKAHPPSAAAKARAKASRLAHPHAHASKAAKLTGQIHLLRNDARLLIQSANHLDAQANGL